MIPLYTTSCETRTRQCQTHHLAQRSEHSLHRHRQHSLISIIHQRHHQNHRHIRNFSEVDNIYINRVIIREIGDNLCPAMDDINSSEVNLCPSYDAIEYDENRTPSIIRQVKCRCPSCVGPYTGEQSSRQCMPIYTYVEVLRVVGCDESNYYEYAHVWEPKSTGCECRILTEEERQRNSHVMPP